MFATSFGVSTSHPTRNNIIGLPMNYVMQVPKGFAVRVFKGSALSAYPTPGKADVDYRPRTEALSRPSAFPSRQETDRKMITAPRDDSAFHVKESVGDRRPHEPKQFGSSGRFAIHPGGIPDTFIYERSFSSKSDILSNGDNSSDDTSTVFSETASVLSSSSTETLQDTLIDDIRDKAARTSRSRSPSPAATRNPAPLSRPALQSQLVDTRAASGAPKSGPTPLSNTSAPIRSSTRPLPVPPPPLESRSDNLSRSAERIIQPDGTTYIRPRLPSMGLGQLPANLQRTFSQQPHPINIKTDERNIPTMQLPYDGYSDIRGMQTPITISTVPDASNSTMRKESPVVMPVPPPPGLGGALVRTDSTSRAVAGSSHDSYFERTPSRAPVVPQRRNSDGGQPRILPAQPVRSNTAPPIRSVRWTENLICPSPIPVSQRRKGWFNRRGDQLWNNDGGYKPPAIGQEYPPDLDVYPEPFEGWQNEEGVRIDLRHRLIPKIPLRSALKRTKAHENLAIVSAAPPGLV